MVGWCSMGTFNDPWEIAPFWKAQYCWLIWSLMMLMLGLHTALTLTDQTAVPSSAHILWFVQDHSGHSDDVGPDSPYWDSSFDLWFECPLHQGLPFWQLQQSLNCSGSPLAVRCWVPADRYESKESNHLKLIDFGFSKMFPWCSIRDVSIWNIT